MTKNYWMEKYLCSLAKNKELQITNSKLRAKLTNKKDGEIIYLSREKYSAIQFNVNYGWEEAFVGRTFDEMLKSEIDRISKEKVERLNNLSFIDWLTYFFRK